jgi:hypothetical protein
MLKRTEMEVLTEIPFELDVASLFDRCHMQERSDDATQFEALLNEARALASPKAVYKESFVGLKGEGFVAIDGVTFTSHALRVNLDKAERVFPYVATCGSELDQINLSDHGFLGSFWLETIKSTVLGSSRNYLNTYLDRKYALGKTASMSPGSGDTTVWPIEQQKQLFSLFGNVNDLIGVELTDSCLMIPSMSVSGIRFPTEIDFRSCMLCHRENCPGRSAPFDKELWGSHQYDNGLRNITNHSS